MGTQAGRTAPQRMGLWVGAALFALLLWLPPPEGFTETAWHAAALAVLMAVWWATEALPIPATSMLPLAAGPLLGIADVETAIDRIKADPAAADAHRILICGSLYLAGHVLKLHGG